MAQKKKSELFRAIDCINYKKPPDFDVSKVNGYILSLWLAQDRQLIGYVQELNPYIFTLTNEAVFWYYYKRIPKGKRFVRWTKKMDGKQPKEIDELCQKYNISPKEARLSIGE